MKKLLSVVLILTLLCTLFCGVAANAKETFVKGDLIANGDMELLGTSFAFWSGFDNTNSRVSTTIARSGERAAKLSANDGTKQIILHDIYGIIPGKNYKFSAYLYVKELLDFSSDVGGIMKIEFYEADGKTYAGSSVYDCFSGNGEKWTLCEIEGIAPEKGGMAKIQLRLDCGGEIYWDDASFVGEVTESTLEEATARRTLAANVWAHSQELLAKELEENANATIIPGVDNVVANPSFEEITADGTAPKNYRGFQGNWGTVTTVTDEEAHTGSRSAKISTDDPAVYLPYIQQVVSGNLVANTDYVLSAWVKAKNMSALNGAMMKIEFYNSAQTSASTYISDAESNKIIPENEEWQEIKLLFTLPEKTNTVVFYLRMTGMGTLYYDDISFGPAGTSANMEFYTKDAFYYTEDGIIEAFADIDYINYPIENESSVEFIIKDGNNVIASQSVPASPATKAEFDVMTLAEKTKKYTISAVYKRADGTVIEESEPKRIYRYDRPTALNEKGQMLDENGKPIDVMFLYGAWEKYFDDYAKAGITVIRPDDVHFSNPENIPEIRRIMDEAHKRGLKVIYQLYGRVAGHPFQIPTTRLLVEEFKDHPALYAWMMMDEPCYNTGVGKMAQTYAEMLEYLEEGYRVIREIDPVHPVYNIESTGVPNSYERAFQYVDIAAIDPYPAQTTQTYHPYNRTKRAVNSVFDEKEVWALGYASDWFLPWEPTEDEYRMNLYTTLWGGAEGIGYYVTDENTPTLMSVLTKVKESGEMHQMYDHFVRKNSPVFNEYMGSDYWMRSWVSDGKLYVLIKEHKNDGKDTPVSFNIESANGLIEINGFTANLVNGTTANVVTSSDSTFSLTLKPAQVSLYEIALTENIDTAVLAEPMFTDLGNHLWAADAIKKMVSKKIANTKGERIYAPGENITRGDFAMYLIRALGLTAEATDQFTDVDESSYYAKEIAIGKALGILKGSGDGTYSPEEPISRQDLMVICARGLRSLNRISSADPDAVLKNFSDTSLIADYAISDIGSMVASRIITGNADLTINPLGNTTRAEAAVIMSRIAK
ncbi:MAG: S-layer homology domain-containing protein [Clostridia bacterium]|nr:S-layer homology domain-containing protein [Clostridia bacterium]